MNKAYVLEDGEVGAPVARFQWSHKVIGHENTHLELFPGYERTLDSLVCKFGNSDIIASS